MLDFSTRKQKIMDLKLKDGTLLQLIVPRAKVYDEIMDFKNTGKNVQIVPNTTKILNQNTQGMQFTEEQVEEMFDVAELSLICTEYIEFVIEAIKDPN
mgnify:FL=1